MEVLLLTTDPTSTTVLPAVDVLPVKVRSAAPQPASLVTAGPYDLLLLDARHDLAAARTLCLPRMPDSLDGLDLLLLTVTTPRKVQRDGIHCHGLRYFSLTLATYVRRTRDRPV